MLIQNPASLGFGGGNVLVHMYKKYIGRLGYDINVIDFMDREDDFDVLHLIGLQPGNCLTGFTAKAKGKKIVAQPLFYTSTNIFLYKLTEKFMSCRLLAFSQNKFFLMQKLLNLSDVVLVSSNSELNQLKYIFSLDVSRVKVIPNGVDADMFQEANKDAFIQRLNLKTSYVLSVANINRKKNVLNLIKAFLETSLETKLVLIGVYNDDADRSYCDEVRKLIVENKKKILHLENISKSLLISAYLNAKIHVLPSFWELPGLVSLEAGLAGARLILGDCGPVRDYFDDLGVYCNPNSVTDMAQKITAVYQLPPTNALSEFIKVNYSWQKIASDIADVYDSL